MDEYKTLLFGALGAVVVAAVWFGRAPAARRARTANDGRPNMIWWVSLGLAVVMTAILANQLPDMI